MGRILTAGRDGQKGSNVACLNQYFLSLSNSDAFCNLVSTSQCSGILLTVGRSKL